MRHTISCTARNRPGVLAKIAGAFADRDINIHNLAVNEAEGEAVSRITVVIECEHAEIETAKRGSRHIPSAPPISPVLPQSLSLQSASLG